MRLAPDSNTINYLFKDRPGFREQLEAALLRGDTFLLCPVVHAELRRYFLLKGATAMSRAYDVLVRSWERCELPFEVWEEYAATWASRCRVGKPLSDFDLLIAVWARAHNVTLVTSNIRHFDDLGVRVVDWSAP